MLNERQRHLLAAIHEQVVVAMEIMERVHRAHLAMIPNVTVSMDLAELNALQGYVIDPIRTNLAALWRTEFAHAVLQNAAQNLGAFTGTAAFMRYQLVLGSLRATLVELLRDPEPAIEAAVEIAFAHLRRSLVVDEHLRERWRVAFDDGEPACERLGGVHLLLHGLWGFKTDASGGRSDLVLGEHVGAIGRSSVLAARGLILTEWKLIRPDDTDAARRAAIEQARRQLNAYSDGILAALELRRVRYVVLVSESQLPPIDDVEGTGFVVRHINVAVAPITPSRLR